MRKRLYGDIATAMHSIPVERPQDLAHFGSGSIQFKSQIEVFGIGTTFTKDFCSGDSIKFIPK